MTEPLHVPDRACNTCPYLKSTPSGVWAPEEYAKLAEYDEKPGETPVLSTFCCHQQTATGVPTICRGWLSVHRESVAVRVACARGELGITQVPQEPEPEYYASGTEACEAGMADIEEPSVEARKKVASLERRGVGR